MSKRARVAEKVRKGKLSEPGDFDIGGEEHGKVVRGRLMPDDKEPVDEPEDMSEIPHVPEGESMAGDDMLDMMKEMGMDLEDFIDDPDEEGEYPEDYLQ